MLLFLTLFFSYLQYNFMVSDLRSIEVVVGRYLNGWLSADR